MPIYLFSQRIFTEAYARHGAWGYKWNINKRGPHTQGNDSVCTWDQHITSKVLPFFKLQYSMWEQRKMWSTSRVGKRLFKVGASKLTLVIWVGAHWIEAEALRHHEIHSTLGGLEALGTDQGAVGRDIKEVGRNQSVQTSYAMLRNMNFILLRKKSMQ